jgi:hypothetical protein
MKYAAPISMTGKEIKSRENTPLNKMDTPEHLTSKNPENSRRGTK